MFIRENIPPFAIIEVLIFVAVNTPVFSMSTIIDPIPDRIVEISMLV